MYQYVAPHKLDDTAIFPRIGAKNQNDLGDKIADILLSADGVTEYWEVFGGSYAVGRKLWGKISRRVYNDTDPYTVAAMGAITVPERLETIMDFIMEKTEYSRVYFNEAKKRFDKETDPDIKAALAWYLLCASRDGACKYFKGIDPTNTPLHFYRRMIKKERHAYTVEGVEVLERDAFELMGSGILDNPQALVYLDPPYVLEKTDVNKLYSQTWTEETQRKFLSLLKGGRAAKIAVSGYQNPLYDAVLNESEGFQLLKLGFYKKTMALRAKGVKVSEGLEVLYTNF